MQAQQTPRYLHGIAAIADQLRVCRDSTELASRLEILASAHLGACGVRLWLAESPDELRRINRRPIPELGETADGVLIPSTASTPPAEAARTGRLVVERGEEREREWQDQQGIAVTAALPLLDENELLGVIHFLSGDSWSEDLAHALSFLGGLIVSNLREKRLREQARQQALGAALAEALSELSRRIPAHALGDDLQPLLESLVEWAIRLTGADEGSLVLRDPSSGECVVRACAGYRSPITGMRVPEGLGVTALALSGRPVFIPDYQQMETALPRIRQRGVRAAFAVPVKGTDGPIGVLTLGAKRRDKQFTETDLHAVQALAGLAYLALERARTCGT